MKILKLVSIFFVFVGVIFLALSWRSIAGLIFRNSSSEPVVCSVPEMEMVDDAPKPGGSRTESDADDVAAAQAKDLAKVKAEAKAAAEAKRAEYEYRAEADAKAKAEKAAAAKASADAESKAKILAEAKAKAEADADKKAADEAKAQARAEILNLVNAKDLNGCRMHSGWKTALTQRERWNVEVVLDYTPSKPKEGYTYMSSSYGLKRKVVRYLNDIWPFNDYNELAKARQEIIKIESDDLEKIE